MSLSWREAREIARRLPSRLPSLRAGAARVRADGVRFPSMKLAIVFVAEKGEPLTTPVR